jgi:hypothetical protein
MEHERGSEEIRRVLGPIRKQLGYAPHGRYHPIACRWVLTGTMPIADPSHRLTMGELWDDSANRLTFCPERSTC